MDLDELLARQLVSKRANGQLGYNFMTVEMVMQVVYPCWLIAAPGRAALAVLRQQRTQTAYLASPTMLQQEQEQVAAQYFLRGGQAGQYQVSYILEEACDCWTSWSAPFPDPCLCLQLMGQVEDSVRKVRAYEDEMAQALALSVIPADELRAAAVEAAELSRAMGDCPALAEQDALAEAVLRWFKVCHSCPSFMFGLTM